MPNTLIINGYNIIYIKNNKNLTSIHAYIKVGSIHETKVNSGIAHLIEHMILDSWKKCKNSCNVHWSKKGIISNGQTTATFTRYFMIGSNDGKQSDMYEYMSSILSEPKFTTKLLQSSKDAVREELTNQLNMSSWKINDSFYGNIIDSTDYRGFSHIMDYNLKIRNLDKINLQQIINYYEKWYTPSSVFLCVCSNESIQEVSKYLTKYLKPNMNNTEVNSDVINIRSVSEFVKVQRPGLKKSSHIIGYLHNNPDKDIFIYKDLIKDLLVGDISSILLLELRDKLNLVYGIDLSFEFCSGFILTAFRISCDFKNSEKLLKEFFKCMENFKKGRFDKKMLDRSINRLEIIDVNNDKKNTEFLNNFYCNQYLLTGKVSNSPETCSRKIKTVSKDRILILVNQIFDDKDLVVVRE